MPPNHAQARSSWRLTGTGGWPPSSARPARLTESACDPASVRHARCSGPPGDARTEVQKLEDPVHGALDVGGVVFQAEDEELLFPENGEPVQEVHGVEANLQPHLGPEKRAGVTPGVNPAPRTQPRRVGGPSRQLPSDARRPRPRVLALCGFPLRVALPPHDSPVGSPTTPCTARTAMEDEASGRATEGANVLCTISRPSLLLCPAHDSREEQLQTPRRHAG